MVDRAKEPRPGETTPGSRARRLPTQFHRIFGRGCRTKEDKMRSETWIQRGFLACAMSIVASTVPAYASDNCVLTQVAKLPLSVSADGTVTVPLTIGGRVLTMAVDAGGTVSALTEPAVAQLRLTPHNYNLRIWH